MASRLNLARAGTAILGVSAMVVLAGGPATAATPGGPSAPSAVTTATPDRAHNKDNGSVDLVGLPDAPTGLLALQPADGGPDIYAYCVQIGIVEGNSHTPMHQAPWTDYPDPNAQFNADSGKVNWILHNSFPAIPVGDLSTAAHAPALTETDAVAATQAAIWHFSDGTDLDSQGNDADVQALYAYLVGTAVELPQPPDDPTLTITAPSDTTGRAGTEIGPFVVDTTLQLVQLTDQEAAHGVTIKIVDAAGHPVDPDRIVNGTRVFFDVPDGVSPGSGSFTVSGGLQIGQMFVGEDVTQAAAKPGGVRRNCPRAHIQTLILAQTSMLSAKATANWVAPPPPPSSTTNTPPTSTTTSVPATTAAAGPTTTPPVVVNTGSGKSLPFTGVNVLAPVVLAIVLIGAGGGFLLVQRRRRRA